MTITLISQIYTVMLIARALMLTLLFVRAAWAIYRNHLEQRARIVIIGTAVLASTGAVEAWVRSWGRVEQLLAGIAPTQANPELALISLIIANIGLIAWITTMEVVTHLGIVPRGTPLRRTNDPKKPN